jgi:hypothetical protein
MVGQFIQLFCRYIGAICVASVASFAVAIFSEPLSWPKMPDSIAMLITNILMVLVGFAGVFLGSFCLPGYHRRCGAFVLVLLGLSFYTFVVLTSFLHNPYATDCSLSLNMPLAGGGLTAALTVCFWRRRPQGGANGEPPLGLWTDRTSPPAAPRRSP